MTKLSSEICFQIRDARRAAKLSQSVVAAEVGCKQSALSMFESGDGTKLNEEVIGKLAKKFGVALTPSSAAAKVGVQSAPTVIASDLQVAARGFCPNPHCPSNKIYEVSARMCVRPDRSAADPVGAKFCALCGEVLEKRCPNCGAPVHEGAFCSFCGEPYVAI